MNPFYASARGMKDEGVPAGPLRQMLCWQTNTATNALRVHASHDAVAIRERLASTIIRRIREVGFG